VSGDAGAGAGNLALQTSGLHATAVAFADTRGVMLIGASGSGKSALALQLMALGARLVADDRCLLKRDGPNLVAHAPPALSGLIEARGVGLIRVAALAEAALVLVIDMDQVEQHRLPPPRSRSWLGIALPLLHKVEGGHFPAAIVHYIGSVTLEPR